MDKVKDEESLDVMVVFKNAPRYLFKDVKLLILKKEDITAINFSSNNYDIAEDKDSYIIREF